MNDMKRLLRYAGPYRRDMVLGAVLVLIETCFELFIPIMIADLIDVGVANHDLFLCLPKRSSDDSVCVDGADYRAFVCALCCEGGLWMGRRDSEGGV